MDYVQPHRSEKTLEFYHRALLVNLSHLFKGFFPAEDTDQFFNTILIPLRELRLSGDGKLAEAHRVRYIQRYDFFVIACAYWVELDLALREGKREDAWSYCMDASYYCATAKVINGKENSSADTNEYLRKARSELAKNAARAKDLPRANVRAKAAQLITELGDTGKTWPSYLQMAKDIKEQILSYAKEQGITMSADRATITISDYLKQVDYLQAFIRKKSTTSTAPA